MFASIHLPSFHLQCALRDDPDGDAPIPIAILEASTTPSERNKARIIQLSPEAAQQGVEPYMTATQALARCAELLLLDRDPDAEAKAQSDLLACAESFTADFESTAPAPPRSTYTAISSAPRASPTGRSAGLPPLG